MNKRPIKDICVSLKCGEYDGVDIMQARIYLQELDRENAELKQQIKDLSKNKIQNDTAHYHQCAKLVDERDELKRIIADRQSKIDALMLEYCPNEMSVEQIVTWSNHQKALENKDTK